VAQDRTAVEAGQAQLYTAADSLAVSKENLNAATSTIRDVDAAEESAQFARENIVSKAGTAMLAQANAMPQSALRLLP
jgi:flagellin